MLANVVVFTASLPASKWWHWDLSPVLRLLFANLVYHLERLHHSKDSRHNPLTCNPGHHLPNLMSLMNQLHLIALLDCSARHHSTTHWMDTTFIAATPSQQFQVGILGTNLKKMCTRTNPLTRPHQVKMTDLQRPLSEVCNSNTWLHLLTSSVRFITTHTGPFTTYPPWYAAKVITFTYS